MVRVPLQARFLPILGEFLVFSVLDGAVTCVRGPLQQQTKILQRAKFSDLQAKLKRLFSCLVILQKCTKRQNWRDSRASFVLPDVDSGNTVIPSTIMRLSANPSLKADLHLNPPGGHLSGTDRATAYGGWVYFRDLFVRTRGNGYKMYFEAYFDDLMDADDLVASSAGASPPTSTSTSSSNIAAKERGLALKSSTLFEVSRS